MVIQIARYKDRLALFKNGNEAIFDLDRSGSLVTAACKRKIEWLRVSLIKISGFYIKILKRRLNCTDLLSTK